MNTHPYPSDLTGEEWTILAPLITPGKRAGHPQVLELRRIVDAAFYLLRTGCQWRAVPHEFPPWPTVFHHYAKWRIRGTWERVNTILRERLRVVVGRKVQPTAEPLRETRSGSRACKAYGSPPASNRPKSRAGSTCSSADGWWSERSPG